MDGKLWFFLFTHFLSRINLQICKVSKIKQQIPNLFTAGNLVGGVLAIVFSLTGYLELAPFCIFISAFLDFFDGFAARLLKVQSELGKQLDSLADMVTFGVAPGVMVFVLLDMPNILSHDSILLNHLATFFTEKNLSNGIVNISQITGTEILQQSNGLTENVEITTHSFMPFLPFIALLIPVMSMFRLAKFNLDTRQSDSFIGVPTPANTLFFASFPLILIQLSNNQASWAGNVSDLILNPVFLVVTTVVFSFLLVAELPLFALKFKSFGWKGNEIRFIFLTACVILLATLWWLAIPLIIILYILLSLIQNLAKK
ncbi:MAG: CDP-alcohol phosphatidyltransferase family protein [Crocinitomicaceae bacterium]|nr:CDP-alcohol phosphatidyltransferase family protein [Crocinitomicaceae bacterium]MBK8924798.1 CDP-alcohol phosphatidyltransferase family protein [Crocinitomicaceae bacterium]